MSVSQKIIPHKGMDIDSDELYVQSEFATFLKNITYQVNDSDGKGIDEGSNAGVFTPLEANYKACNLKFPDGENHVVGFYESKEFSEGYVFVHNSNSNHFIYRINKDRGNCELIIETPCLNFQLNPAHFIGKTRCTLQSIAYLNNASKKEEVRKFLIFTDNFNTQRFISVEDAILTNGFDPIRFPYFNTGSDCDKCNFINLGMQQPTDCIGITTVKRDSQDISDATKPNLLNYKTWQFRVKYIDVWGRESEHGNISDMFIISTGSNCVSSSNGLPRCIKLNFKAGCPLVDKIQIEFRNCNGNTRGLSTESDWFLYDVIDKYNDCGTGQWFERTIRNPYQEEYDRLISTGMTTAEAEKKAGVLLKYDSITNTFQYHFCGDKECQPISPSQTNRSFNPLPITSSSVFSIAQNIGLANNRRGFPVLDCNVIDKIKFSVIPPEKNNECDDFKLRKITVWAFIYNIFNETYTPIRRDGNRNVFGVSDCTKNNPFTYQQIFPADQEGFIGYLAGTKHYCISKQYSYNRLTGEYEYTGIPFNPGATINFFKRPLQKFEFSVLPGKYIFRISGHRSAPTDDYQKTSTYTIGQTPISSLGQLSLETNEFVINVCDEDVEIKDPMMIYDLTHTGNNCLGEATNVVEGYLYEDEINKIPIELARVQPNNGKAFRRLTDHNGHYFSSTRKNNEYVRLYGLKSCTINSFLAKSDTAYDGDYTKWYRFNDLYAYKKENKYPATDRILIKGRVGLCTDANIGLQGVLVVLKRGQFAYTDANGEFVIVAHDRGDIGGRIDDLIYSQRGTCHIYDCDDRCKFCFTDVIVNAPACNGLQRVFNVTDKKVNVKGLNLRGPKNGGRYGLGFKLHDWAGRKTFIQSNDSNYIDIPSIQETGVFDFSKIKFSIDPGIIFPDYATELSFYITENLNYDDDLTWVAERIQYVDNTGNTNNAAPTQIRLYYEGLGEYNKQNNFSTNSVWQFILDTEAPVTGDQVEFIANGDGQIFNKRITSLVKYDKDGKYFSVDYTDQLKDLKDGVLIKLIRPKQCINKNFYYKICPVIKIKNGRPDIYEGTFNFFDSYMLTRQIPVPVEKKTSGTSGEIVTTTENQLKNYPFLFEHHSPSDLWGDHCWNKGEVNTKNPFENQRLLRTEIALSDAVSNNGIINGLGRFDEENTVVFDEQQWSGITGVFPELNNVLIICEHDFFIVPFNDTGVQVDPSGNVVARSAENKFGRPERKIGNNFGCQSNDINTIQIRNGIVVFLDRSRSGLVINNFSEAADLSFIGINSWIRTKTKFIDERNGTDNNEKYFHGIIDPKHNKYFLTDFELKAVQIDADFINDSLELNPQISETMSIDLDNKSISYHSFTPEYYGCIEGHNMDKQLISFRKGEAWFHHELRNANNRFNNFFGRDCEWVIEVIANIDNTKQKKFTWVEFYCKEIQPYIDRIMTESGQASRLMPNWWDRREKFWAADFKCAINSIFDSNINEETGINVLLDGDVLYGRWIKTRFRPHPKFINNYFELTAIIINMIAIEKSST